MKLARIYNDGRLAIKGELIEGDKNKLMTQGDLIIAGEIIEQEPIEIFFEDNFNNGSKKQDWSIERWGANPNNIVEEPYNGGWRFRQNIGGHASIAIYKKLPYITKGKLIIEFDWQPYGVEGSYRGSWFTIRGSGYTRGDIYGQTSYTSPPMLQLNAYSYQTPRIIIRGGYLDYCNSSIYELGRYKIIIDVDANTMSIYNDGVLINTYANANYVDDLYMEFTFGAYSAGQYSYIDNVKIKIDENIKPFSLSQNGNITITDIIEGGV
jgi:hypothetical protein